MAAGAVGTLAHRGAGPPGVRSGRFDQNRLVRGFRLSNLLAMPSVALRTWLTARAESLDEVEDAHEAVGGAGRGRRFATLQINHAYVMLVSSQFQGFCRDLHSESVAFLVANTTPTSIQQILRTALTQGRKLDQGNPNPGNIGSDFAHLGMSFWDSVAAVDGRKRARQAHLELLNTWRNAIAHQDWTKVGGSPALRLAKVKAWRAACDGLASSFDAALKKHLTALVGAAPW